MNPSNRRRSAPPRVSGWVALAGVCLLSVGTALAQPQKKEEPLRPPTPPTTGSSWSPVLSVLVGLVMSGLVLGAAFIPSKRGHQD